MERKTKKPSKIAALRAWVNRHRLATMIIGGLLAITVAGNVALALLGQPLPKLIPDIIAHKPKPKVYYSPLTGLKVKSQAATTKPVTAIMIENNLDGRPQSGLKQAEVVYEAIAEGDITRFMAFYQQNKNASNSNHAGPVRLHVRVIAGAHHRAHGGMREAHLVRFFLVHLESVRSDEAPHGQVVT